MPAFKTKRINGYPVEVEVAPRPFTITFSATRTSYPLSAEEVARLGAEYPTAELGRNKLRLRGDDGAVSTIRPATLGGGDAFTVSPDTAPEDRPRGHYDREAPPAEVTEEELDAATDRVRELYGGEAPAEPCEHGHYECAHVEGGACEGELVDRMLRS